MSATLSLKTDIAVHPARIHLDYLDGLRGLAALYVVYTHVVIQVGLMHAALPVSHFWHFFNGFFSWGRGAVAIFIVLSGYCLMMPVSKSATLKTSGTLRGGVAAFLKRRARRILPPYYAALAVSWLLIGLMPNTHRYVPTAWPLFAPQVVLSHLLLIHNLSSHWANRINGALWSVATEWQIYFIFALLLLPLYKKFNIMLALAVAIIAGILPHLLLHQRLDSASFHYLALFAFGMLASEINFSPHISQRIRSLPWSSLSIAVTILFFAFFLWRGQQGSRIILDTFFGVTAAIFLTASTFALQSRRSTPALRLLSARPVIVLGTFSYSLYLIHDPLLYSCISVLRTCHIPAIMIQPILAGAVPVVVAVAYLFHLAFERPFMSKPGPKTERQAEVAAIVNPAP